MESHVAPVVFGPEVETTAESRPVFHEGGFRAWEAAGKFWVQGAAGADFLAKG
eukprot:CAMPEP_0184280050 /NCGR_PEP_ID=MMETSP0977-20130417/57539_1 /TAXON_ID=483370 /ORGANISM="non described non described, Strain CCMP2097" /LENGTH=52 /DNA_ID=CAMNT_0026586003 /DNA_START=14 /DNA_END=169 /DNA_ORIENTATION=+